MTRRQLITTAAALATLPGPALAQPGATSAIRPRPNPGPEDGTPPGASTPRGGS